LLCADGCNQTAKHKVALAICDARLVRSFRSALNYGGPIRIERRRAKNPNHTDRACLTVSSVRLSRSLANLGCGASKTARLAFPLKLPNELSHHFVRGYFDGDGSIFWSSGRPRVAIAVTRNFGAGLQALLSRHGIHLLLRPHTHAVHTLGTQRRAVIQQLGKWMYRDATISMTRKRRRLDRV
jgi:hypothetical protein